MEKIQSIMKHIIFGLCLFFCSVFLIMSFFFTSDHTGSFIPDQLDNILIHIFVLLFLGVFLFFMRKRTLSGKAMWVLIAGVALVLAALLVVFGIPVAYGDSDFICKGVKLLLDGDLTFWLLNGYINKYPNNNFMAMYVYYIFKCFGSDGGVLAAELFNIVYWLVFAAALYGCLKILLPCENAGVRRIGLLCSVMFLPLLFNLNNVYGTIPGLALSVCACYFMLCYLRGSNYAIAGCMVCIGAACLFKQNYLIMLIAILIILILASFTNKRFHWVPALLLFVTVFAGGSFLTSRNMERITGVAQSDGMPTLAWIALGLRFENPKAPGIWDGWTDYTYALCDGDREIMNEKAAEMISFRLSRYTSNIRYGIKFLLLKNDLQWNNPEFEAVYTQNDGYLAELFRDENARDKIEKLVWTIMNELQTVFWLGLISWLVQNYHKAALEQSIFVLFFIGGVLFHLMWEAGARYALPYIVLLIPYAAAGFYHFVQKTGTYIGDRIDGKEDR